MNKMANVISDDGMRKVAMIICSQNNDYPAVKNLVEKGVKHDIGVYSAVYFENFEMFRLFLDNGMWGRNLDSPLPTYSSVGISRIMTPENYAEKFLRLLCLMF